MTLCQHQRQVSVHTAIDQASAPTAGAASLLQLWKFIESVYKSETAIIRVYLKRCCIIGQTVSRKYTEIAEHSTIIACAYVNKILNPRSLCANAHLNYYLIEIKTRPIQRNTSKASSTSTTVAAVVRKIANLQLAEEKRSFEAYLITANREVVDLPAQVNGRNVPASVFALVQVAESECKLLRWNTNSILQFLAIFLRRSMCIAE